MNAAPIEPGSSEWVERVFQLADETAVPPDSWWYISFCDDSLPTGSQFLGACYVQASSMPHALTVAHQRGCNPGGGASITGPVPSEVARCLPAQFTHMLMTREQVAECDALMDAPDG